MPCITCWQDMYKACLDSESRALFWYYQLQTKWMGKDRLSEILGCRWRGSYLQRDRNTVWFDAEHFYKNGVFQIIFHVRRAKESSAIKMYIKKWVGENEWDMNHAVEKHFMGLAAQVVWRSWAFHWLHFHCAVHYPNETQDPDRPFGLCVSDCKVTSWWFITQGFLSTVLVKLLNLSCRPIPAAAKICSWQWTQICW